MSKNCNHVSSPQFLSVYELFWDGWLLKCSLLVKDTISLRTSLNSLLQSCKILLTVAALQTLFQGRCFQCCSTANSCSEPFQSPIHSLLQPVTPNGRVKRIWYLSPMRAAKVQASLRIRAVSPEPPLLAHISSESRGTFKQKARSLAPLNGWACAVKICHDGMLEDTNRLTRHIFPEYVNSFLYIQD